MVFDNEMPADWKGMKLRNVEEAWLVDDFLRWDLEKKMAEYQGRWKMGAWEEMGLMRDVASLE